MDGRGWAVDLTCAFTCVYFNEPLIPVFAYALRGFLLIYGRYLADLDFSTRIHHELSRNTAFGVGLVFALPLLIERQTMRGLLCGVVGAAIGLLVMLTINHGASDKPRTLSPHRFNLPRLL